MALRLLLTFISVLEHLMIVSGDECNYVLANNVQFLQTPDGTVTVNVGYNNAIPTDVCIAGDAYGYNAPYFINLAGRSIFAIS